MNVINDFLNSPLEDKLAINTIPFNSEDIAKTNHLFFSVKEKTSNCHIGLIPKIQKNQLWTIKNEYIDYNGDKQQAFRPIIILISSDVEYLDVDTSFVRVFVVSPFVEMASENDVVCSDPTVIGFPFLVECWNEQPILTEILDQYIGEFFGVETIDMEEHLSVDKQTFRELEISNSRFLNHSILAYMNYKENAENFSFSVDFFVKGHTRTIHMPIMNVYNPKLIDLPIHEEYALAAKTGKAITDDDFADFLEKELPFQIQVRKKPDGYILTIIPRVDVSVIDSLYNEISGMGNSDRIVYSNLSKGIYTIKSPLLNNEIIIRLK